MDIFSYMMQNSGQVLDLLLEHIRLTAVAVGLAILVGVPLGILISYVKSLNKPILGITNLIQAVPSMALLGFAIPLLGIGTIPAVGVVFLYSLLPIVKNTYIGISQIKPEMIEAAKGIGMTRAQILRRVQIPLTLPVLMAGVRISAVTAVGLMTIAAFIGAGGLGFLVFSGISSVNNGMIMAGAVPACILALVLDWVLAQVEALVTPVSLQPGVLAHKAKLLKSRTRKKWSVAVVAVLLVALFGNSAYTSFFKDNNVIRIGSKQFTEQLILGNMLAEMIEDNTNLKVETHLGAGGTQVLFNAMRKGELDGYIDYTGTMYVDVLKHKPTSNAAQVYDTSKKELQQKYGMTLLDPTHFSNTYTLAVPQNVADEYGLVNMSDLAKSGSDLDCVVGFLCGCDRCDSVSLAALISHDEIAYFEIVTFIYFDVSCGICRFCRQNGNLHSVANAVVGCAQYCALVQKIAAEFRNLDRNAAANIRCFVHEDTRCACVFPACYCHSHF